MEKQTAVSWLVEQLANNGIIHSSDIHKAKEMEKQELEQFYNHGQWAMLDARHGECFEDYYNRTFKLE
jgi:hypothetical protein